MKRNIEIYSLKKKKKKKKKTQALANQFSAANVFLPTNFLFLRLITIFSNLCLGYFRYQ